MVIARCELVNARSTVPMTRQGDVAEDRRSSGSGTDESDRPSADRLLVFLVVVEGNRLRRSPSCLGLRHQPLAVRHAIQIERRSPEGPRRSIPTAWCRRNRSDDEAERQTHEHAAEQLGDDLPGLTRRRLTRQLVRDFGGAVRASRADALSLRRLIASSRDSGGRDMAASALRHECRRGSEFGAEPIGETPEGQGGADVLYAVDFPHVCFANPGAWRRVAGDGPESGHESALCQPPCHRIDAGRLGPRLFERYTGHAASPVRQRTGASPRNRLCGGFSFPGGRRRRIRRARRCRTRRVGGGLAVAGRHRGRSDSTSDGGRRRPRPPCDPDRGRSGRQRRQWPDPRRE